MVNAAVRLGIDPAAGFPERALAFQYAPADARAALEAIFALDATLANLARGTRDPMVAQLRLAWWRDALIRLDAGPVPAQPVLRALADDVLPRGVTGSELAMIVEAWEALLDEDNVLTRHARQRGGRLFEIAARVLGAAGDPVTIAGEGWALADFSIATTNSAVAAEARLSAIDGLDQALHRRWTVRSRALGALAHVAWMDLAGHRPGSPRRVGRLLVHRLTGR